MVKSFSNRSALVFWALLPAVLAGCAAPQAARDEARLTALYATRVRLDAAAFAQARDSIAKARTRNMNALETAAFEAEREISVARSVWQISDNNARLWLFDDLRQATELVGAQQQQLEEMQNAQREALTAAHSGVKLREDKLTQAAKQLAKLADPPDKRAELAFYWSFIRAVKDEVDKLKKDAEKSANDALAEAKNKSAN